MSTSGEDSFSPPAAQGSPVPPSPGQQPQRAQSPPLLVGPLRKKQRLAGEGGRDLTPDFQEEAAAKQVACEAKEALGALLAPSADGCGARPELPPALVGLARVRAEIDAKARGDGQDAQDQSAAADDQIAARDAIESVLLAVPALGAAGGLQDNIQAALGTLQEALEQSSPAELAMRIVSDCGPMGGGRRRSRRSRPKSRKRAGSRKRPKARKSKRKRKGKPRRASRRHRPRWRRRTQWPTVYSTSSR